MSSKGASNPVDGSSSLTKKGYIYDNLTTDGYATADHEDEETRTVKEREHDRDDTEKTGVLSHLLESSSHYRFGFC